MRHSAPLGNRMVSEASIVLTKRSRKTGGSCRTSVYSKVAPVKRITKAAIGKDPIRTTKSGSGLTMRKRPDTSHTASSPDVKRIAMTDEDIDHIVSTSTASWIEQIKFAFVAIRWGVSGAIAVYEANGWPYQGALAAILASRPAA